MNGTPAPHRLHLPEVLVLIALVVITAAVFVPAQAFVASQMESLKEDVINELESQIGREITYESISPSILRAVEIRGLVINGNEDEPDHLLEVERLRIFYHPFRLLLGGPDATAAEIRIVDTEFNIHHERDADVIDFIEELASREDEGPSATLKLSGRNVGLTYQDSDGTYTVDDVFFQSTIREEEVTFYWESNFATELPAGLPVADDRAGEESAASELTGIEARATIQGTIRPGEENTSVRVSVPWIRTPLFRVRDQRFDVSFDGSEFEIRKLQNKDPIDLSVTADADLEVFELSLLADGFIPEDVVSFRGSLSALEPWLRSELRGDAEMKFERSSGELSYSADVWGQTNNRDLPEQMEIRAVLSGDARAVGVEELTLRPQNGELRFSGSIRLSDLTPEGEISLSGFSYAETAPLTGVLEVSRAPSGELRASSPHISYGDGELYEVDVLTGTDPTQASYEASFSFDEEGESKATVGGLVREQRLEEATLKLVRAPSRRVYEMAGEFADLPDGIGRRLESVLVDTRLELRRRNEAYELDASYVSVQDQEELSRFAYFGASLRDSKLRIRNLAAGFDGHVVQGEFGADLSDGSDIPFESALDVEGRSFDVSGTYRDGQRLELSTLQGLTAELEQTQAGDYVFSVEADEVELPSAWGGSHLSVIANGSFSSPEQWSARVTSFTLAEPTGADSQLSLSAELGAEGGTISRVAYRDAVSSLEGQGEFTYGDGSDPTVDLGAEASDTDEQYELSLSYSEGDLGGTLEIVESPLERVGLAPIRGVTSGTLDLETLLSDPRLTLQFETEEATFNADSIAAQGVLRVSQGSLVVNRMNVRYLTNSLTNARGTVDLQKGEATLSALIEDRESDTDEPIEARAQATFAPENVPLRLEDIGSAPFDGRVQFAGIDFPQGHEGPWEFDVRRTAEELLVDGGPDGSMSAQIEQGGAFRVSVADPMPIRFSAEGVLEDGEIESNVTNIFVDMAGFASPLGGPTVRLTEGRFSGALRVVGAVNDPDFFGTLEARDVGGEIDFIAEPLGPADTFIVFQEKVAEINRFVAPVGEASAEGSGTIIFNRWTPEEYRLRIEAQGDPGVHVVNNFGGLVVDGHGRGDIEVRGTSGRTEVTGDILVDQTSLTLGEQVDPAERREGRATTVVDFNFRTVGPTEFLWPNEDFPVLRALAERGEEVELSYASDTGEFSLQGRMNIQAGEIYYFDRSFYVREGHITFDEDEEEFDPRLAVRAEIREVSNEGPVRVYLIVDEERLSSFTPRFESSPPLSDSELIALLGGNLLTRESGEDVDFSQAVLLTSDLVTQFGVINRLERSARSALGLDLFS
ncbi:MAG: translocation/assembly module TamB domain-containing protein, partial [Spirochaetia bacterium]